MKSGRRKVRFWRRSRRRRQELVAECEAFLNGSYLDGLVDEGECLPPWVWINTLAHGQRADIEALADGRGGHPGGTGAAQYFAREVLATVDLHGLDLRALQRELLIPVELRCDSAASARVTKALCTNLLIALRRAGTIANLRSEAGTLRPSRHRPDNCR
jgi:hypothetical protein